MKPVFRPFSPCKKVTFGIVGDIIQYIFDDHPQKVGRYTSGDGIPIVPTEELLKRMPDYTIILAWVHAPKIIAANQKYLEKGGKFVVVSPDASIVDLNGAHPVG
jgi:hypothetical protein